MKKLILTIVLITICFWSFSQNEKLQAVFVFNFTKYISWPQNYSTDDFSIGVLGSEQIANELKIIAEKRMVGSRKIIVTLYNNYKEIKKCNIIIISSSKSSQLSKVISQLSSEPTVVITNSPGLIEKGSGINFVVLDNKQKFEIRKSNVEKNGVKLNSELLKLGVEK